LGRLDVGRLTFLFSGMKQNDDDAAGFAVIDSIPGTDVDLKLKNALTDRFRIAEQSSSNARQASGDNLLRRRVERIQPFLKRPPIGICLVVTNLDRSDLHFVAS